MIITKRGRPRRATDEQCRIVRAWKPLKKLSHELGLSRRTVEMIRSGYKYKQVSP